MNPWYQRARFLTSAVGLSQCPPDKGLEVAFAGRSNAGKSSAINALCQQKGLARTSKVPGRTQMLNFFSLDDGRRLVDLPGYGYARVAEAVKAQWQNAMATYLEQRSSLRGLILVMDIRHPLTAYDRQMLAWSRAMGLPTHLLLTKADKLKAGQAARSLQEVKRELVAMNPESSVQLFSAHSKRGIDEAQAVLDSWFGLPPNGPTRTNERNPEGQEKKRDPGTKGE